MRLLKKHWLLSTVNGILVDYPSPTNISYFWNFGSLAGLTLIIQIVTGVFLVMHYTPHVDLAFSSIEHIMRDVNFGWVIRYIHANGASMFFIVMYLHMFRGLYYGSYMYPREVTWFIGVTIFLVTMGVAFLGYVLPWGQMSFWGATVITSLVSAIPYIGTDIVYWIWGGFSVDNATLNRFFSLHYLLPFVIAALSGLHLITLHANKSNNPLGVMSHLDRLPFHPYFTTKDLYGMVLFLIVLSTFVFFFPNYLGHSDNYINANPLVTPSHIVPEWYFLPFYAILRSIPHKLGGVIAMLLSIVILYLLPYLNTSNVRSVAFRPLYKKGFWFLAVSCIILGWIGGSPVESPYYEIGQIATVFYFSYFLIILPLTGLVENTCIRGKVISPELYQDSSRDIKHQKAPQQDLKVLRPTF